MIATFLAQGNVIAGQAAVFIQYGALGAISLCAMLAVRVLFQRETKSLDLERARADRLEEELRKLNQSITEKYIPVLERATTAIALTIEAHRNRESR